MVRYKKLLTVILFAVIMLSLRDLVTRDVRKNTESNKKTGHQLPPLTTVQKFDVDDKERWLQHQAILGFPMRHNLASRKELQNKIFKFPEWIMWLQTQEDDYFHAWRERVSKEL